MNHQNSSSSSYYNYHQSDFQNPNPQFDHFTSAITASAPPDPSMYYSPDYSSNYFPTDPHNPTPHTSGLSNPSYDPNSISYWNQNQNQNQMEVRFDDYGRPISSSAATAGNNDSVDHHQGGYGYGYSGGHNVGNDRSPVVRFDDYGRPISYGDESRKERRGSADGDKVLKAAEAKEEWSGVQKFRVVLLSEGGGGDTDVLCQIGLDGIQILDPATSRTLKVYSLEAVTKWEVLDSNIFAFWTKSSIDINPRRVRLKSNSYTTTKILDTVAAASFQFKEIDGVTISEQQPAEKKKGFPDWINLMKPTNEEKDHWVPDEASTKCTACSAYFGAFVRRHHCRNCGDIFCDKCTQGRIALTAEENAQQVRVCDQCLAEVTQRLSHVNEVAGRSSGFNRHEDLAKKLQEEMEKKRKTTAELNSNVPRQQMKEVECPTCTVHLQVEVPANGSKTIKCSVCQHPFLVRDY
ncbi:putative chromatin regulator PHD family [Helianthus annuus]|nr:putative chromatin regulator PHD family [Helianthus annuus]KAJ0823566.1 putative chromatin regulator PHD family [Helianthus annuus]KAJ0838303.1 putative chromatin regulator PHD family [Helianthus annuus]